MKTQHIRFAAVGLILACLGAVALGAPIPGDILASVGMLGCVGNIDLIMKELDKIEPKLAALATKADMEAKFGEISADTKSQIEGLGTKQRELADRLLSLEQKGSAQNDADTKEDDWGQQFIKADAYSGFAGGRQKNVSISVKNTVTNTVGNTLDQQRPDFVGGAFRTFTLEQRLMSLNTTSDAVQYVRENVFTNNAAETTEGAALPESSITTTLVTDPICDVGHFVKISRQLSRDNTALAAYINTRMRYGVNLRFENQLIAGNGIAPNIGGFSKAGNNTPHGYTAAALVARFGANWTRIDLIRAIIADCAAADYPADAILLNPVDWATIETLKDSQGRYLVGNPNDGSAPRLWRVPVVESNAVTADTVGVASLAQAATLYNREDVVVELSEHDGSNFQQGLVTIRAIRRGALAVERPAAFRYGDLTPS